ncbi:MAG: YybH family protein [Gemmatimonadaceae bacterium]
MLTHSAKLGVIRKLFAVGLLAAFTLPSPANAQGLRDKISDLFIFGPGQEPLFLAGSGDPNNPASLQAHGLHFIPSSSAENGALIAFITDALGASIGSIPIGSTSGGETFRFEGGMPVKTSTSAGPIFAERAQTLGRGRVLAGISRTAFRFATLRGVDMNNIDLTFTHQNVNFSGCSAQFGADCALYGVPVLENDVMDFRLSMNLNVQVTSTSDAVVLFANVPPMTGSSAIRSGWSDIVKIPAYKVHWTPTWVDVASPTRAIEYGTYTESYDTPAGKTSDAGNYVTVWHKVNGKWRIALDAPVSTTPLPINPGAPK